MKDLKSILFATDFSDCSEAAFGYAILLARKFHARLLIVHVINEPVDLRGFYVPHISFDTLEAEIEASAKKMMQDFCAKQLFQTDDYVTEVIPGIPYEEIIKRAEEERVDLVVLGTHGRSGLDHLLFGSTAEKVVRKSSIPVMTIRQKPE